MDRKKRKKVRVATAKNHIHIGPVKRVWHAPIVDMRCSYSPRIRIGPALASFIITNSSCHKQKLWKRMVELTVNQLIAELQLYNSFFFFFFVFHRRSEQEGFDSLYHYVGPSSRIVVEKDLMAGLDARLV